MSAAEDRSAEIRERALAAEAAAALRATLADQAAAGEGSTIYASGRPKYWHITSWEKLPGFTRTVAGSTRARSQPPTTTYTHDLLPGWTYEADELPELLRDLDNLAAGRGQPVLPTRGPGKPRGPALQKVLPL